MKNTIKSIFTVIFAILFYGAIAQGGSQSVTSYAQPVPVPVQGGIGHLTNGACTINLDDIMSVETYFVAITPHEQNSGLYVVKQDHLFIVSGSGKDMDFDYVIFRNEILSGTNAHKVVSIPRHATEKQ